MRKEQEIFTQLDVQNVPVGDDILDMLEQEIVNESIIREYINALICESHFPLTAGEKVRIHHSRQGSRDGGAPKTGGFTQRVGFKPKGLWYECQDASAIDWKEFCEAGLTGGASRYDSSYDVVLNDYEILFITDKNDFKKFEKMYGIPNQDFPEDVRIDWPKVTSHYDGIEICPYQADMRMDSEWYYGWDVASGCVWNASGIKELVNANEGCKDETTP